MNDLEKFKAMKALGVKWKYGHALPNVTNVCKPDMAQVDALYDSMSEAFLNQDYFNCFAKTKRERAGLPGMRLPKLIAVSAI